MGRFCLLDGIIGGNRLDSPVSRHSLETIELTSKVSYSKYTHESFDEWWYTGGIRPLHLPPMTPTQREPLDRLYHTTKVPRLRTRAQMVLLAAEPGRKVLQMARIVRASEATVLRWLKRDLAEGLEGVHDAPRPGRPSELTEACRAAWLAAVRRRPRSLGFSFSLWTLPRLVDDLAEQTGLRVSDATVRRALKQAGLVRSRPQHRISRPDPEDAVKKSRLKTPALS
jgi:transposase